MKTGALLLALATSTDVLAKLRSGFPTITTTADNAEAAGCERVFLALHPPTQALGGGASARLDKRRGGRAVTSSS